MSLVRKRVLFWTPRILAILFAVFLGVFALDVFRETHGFLRVVLALALHLLPAGTVVVMILVAWRRRLVGAVLFALMATIYAVRVLPVHPSWAAVVSGPLLAIALLFLAGWLAERPARVAP